MSPLQVMFLVLILGVTFVGMLAAMTMLVVYLVRTISEGVSTTLATSLQRVTSPGVVEQPTPTWQTMTTVPWEDWERPGETPGSPVE